jgi:membrane protein DedA with SNARE-associated domain
MGSLVAALAGLALGTLVSEDLTLLAAGVAVAEGRLPGWPAAVACATGLFLGDVGLWCAGRLGRRPLARWRSATAVGALVGWLDRAPVVTILASRVLPGTRLPLYVAAGAWSRRSPAILLAMLGAAVVWTPICIGGVVVASRVLRTAPSAVNDGVWTLRCAALVVGASIVLAARRRGAIDSGAVLARLERLRCWEFWPAWLVNTPVVVWVLLLGIRHRSLTLFTAANPGIEDVGLVGESKAAILATLPAEWTLPWILATPGPVHARVGDVHAQLATRRWTWPLVAKPDASQRGVAVRWIRTDEALAAYLDAVPGPVVLQQPHDGPFEAGLYYVRAPGARHGHLTSITDKRFPSVVGDGHTSIAGLIAQHPRYRVQMPLLQARLGPRLADVPSIGEVVVLGRVGNHAQGTMFLDGSDLWTPALEARVDAIARAVPGFHIGRFDVRYRDRAAFMSGQDLAIVELNGVAAEPTHVYDPDASLLAAWRALCRHWTTAFRIAAANRAAGHQPASLPRVVTLVWRHLRSTPPTIVSD